MKVLRGNSALRFEKFIACLPKPDAGGNLCIRAAGLLMDSESAFKKQPDHG